MERHTKVVTSGSVPRDAELPASSTPSDVTTTQEQSQEKNQSLQRYDSLFGQKNSDVSGVCDKKTALQLTPSLNYSLYTFLHLCDASWLLAMIDIDEIDVMNDNKISQVDTVIKDFCESDARKLKGYRLKRDSNDCVLFALLMYCHPKLNESEKFIPKLMKKIKLLTNMTVSVGIAKMNKWETFDEWKQRAIKNMKNVENTSKTGMNTFFYNDIDVKYKNPKEALGAASRGHGDDEKQTVRKQEQRQVKKFGNKEEFHCKMKNIANNKNYDWIAAIMEIDVFDSVVFLNGNNNNNNNNNNNKEAITSEIDKIETETYHLFDIFGNGIDLDKDEMKYFGYKLNGNGNRFGLILYDSKDTSKCYIPARDILETLKEEICIKCSFTVSIGSSRLFEDDLGIMDDWIERINNNLKQAKQNNGKQEACFAQSGSQVASSDKIENKSDNTDTIELNRLPVIEKYGFAAGVSLKNVKIVANSGDLLNADDSDVKLDVDPTQEIVLNFNSSRINTKLQLELTYKQIYLETVQFINENNNKEKAYLEYPKMYLYNQKLKCNDQQRCKQCYNNSVSHNNNEEVRKEEDNIGMLSLCKNTRQRIADELYDCGVAQECSSNSLCRTAAKMFINDELLIKQSNEYKLIDNWFAKVYSFLKWWQETTIVLLQDLVDSNTNGMQGSDAVVDNFDVLVLLHLYLDQLIEYLILYFCCFDSQRWIAVFHPFFEVGIGTKHCKMLFTESKNTNTESTNIVALCIEATKFNQTATDVKNRILKEMKRISIFKRILFDVYRASKSDKNDSDIGNRMEYEDAFDLMYKISVKLKENTNNIKRQIFTHTIGTAANEVLEDISNDKITSDEEDDWAIDESEVKNNNKYNLKVPSFIRLFVVRRIICKYLDDTSTADGGNVKQSDTRIIEDLVNVFDNDKQVQSTAKIILTRLINNGIKKYMKKWYNESEQANIIEMIFNKIILNKFEKEYNQLTTYLNGNYYQQLVFNSSDVMCTIFQYLEYGKQFDKDLFSCSLVNSCWLYHVWDINSIYKVCLDVLIEHTTDQNDAGDDKYNYATRVWQRLIHVRWIEIYLIDWVYENKLLLERLSLLKNVEKVRIHLSTDNKLLKTIMSRCKNGVKHYDVRVVAHKVIQNRVSPLKITNAQCIKIHDLYSYTIWSNKCQELHLCNIEDIGEEWCQFVIENCDCSNITNLEWARSRFHKKFDNNSILNKLAPKFTNLQQLKIKLGNGFDRKMIVLWKLLRPIIVKNNVKVSLETVFLKGGECHVLNYALHQQGSNVNIEKLIVDKIDDAAIWFIQQRDIYG